MTQDEYQRMITGFSYKESQFTKKDYHILYDMATPGTWLRVKLRGSKFRDKKFQRTFKLKADAEVFYAPFNQLPKYINAPTQVGQDILKWRFKINK